MKCSFFIIFRKQIIQKVSFFRSFFDDSDDMIFIEQTQACQIFHISCFDSLVGIHSSKFEVKMEGTKFYETLYKRAFEFVSSRDLIQQTDLIQQNTKVSTAKSSNQIEYIKLFFYPLFKKDSIV